MSILFIKGRMGSEFMLEIKKHGLMLAIKKKTPKSADEKKRCEWKYNKKQNVRVMVTERVEERERSST